MKQKVRANQLARDSESGMSIAMHNDGKDNLGESAAGENTDASEAAEHNSNNIAITMNIERIPAGNHAPDDINVIIEVPVGGEPIKYELDKYSGALFVDRFLYTPMRYPGNYGFIPHTLSDDGDPVDVLVANTRSLLPGSVINCRPIGVLNMEDDGGEDEKIIAVPSSDVTMRYAEVENYTDLPEISRQQIQHFFEHYKDLEPGKWVKIESWGDAAQAKRLIKEGMKRDQGKRVA